MEKWVDFYLPEKRNYYTYILWNITVHIIQCRRRQIESGWARLILKNFDKQKKKTTHTSPNFENPNPWA